MKTYSVESGLIHSELFNTIEGAMSNSETNFIDDLNINESSLIEVIKAIKSQFKAINNELSFNACNEVGRLDIQWLSKTRNSKTRNFKTNGFLMNASLYIIETVTNDADLIGLTDAD